MEAVRFHRREKATFRSLPLEIQQQICSHAIALSMPSFEDTFLKTKLNWFNPVRVYNGLETCLETCIGRRRLISARRFLNVWHAFPNIEPVRRGGLGPEHMLYIKLTALDASKVVWLMKQLQASNIALDLRDREYSVSFSNALLRELLRRAEKESLILHEMLVIMPSCNMIGDYNIPRSVESNSWTVNSTSPVANRYLLSGACTMETSYPRRSWPWILGWRMFGDTQSPIFKRMRIGISCFRQNVELSNRLFVPAERGGEERRLRLKSIVYVLILSAVHF